MRRCTSVWTSPDAYVFCASKLYVPEAMTGNFGGFCVRIEDAERFYDLLEERMKPVTEGHWSTAGPVKYRSREFSEDEDGLDMLGFVKPPDQYASQTEFRMLWRPDRDRDLERFTLQVPEAASLCTQVWRT